MAENLSPACPEELLVYVNIGEHILEDTPKKLLETFTAATTHFGWNSIHEELSGHVINGCTDFQRDLLPEEIVHKLTREKFNV